MNLRQKDLYYSILSDNLNLPLFLEKFQKLVGEVLDSILKNQSFKPDNINAIRVLEDSVLSLDLWPEIPVEITANALNRKNAKAGKNYQEADRIRDLIQSEGWDIGDFAWGYGLWKIR